jgi:hypothetical protein
MFRASLCPSSGQQTVCQCLWFPVLAMVVVVQATSSEHCTHLATWLSRTTTTIARTGNHRQWHTVCSPDDGRKDAWNMLRNNWLTINHHLLQLVGLAFICTTYFRNIRMLPHFFKRQIKYNKYFFHNKEDSFLPFKGIERNLKPTFNLYLLFSCCC